MFTLLDLYNFVLSGTTKFKAAHSVALEVVSSLCYSPYHVTRAPMFTFAMIMKANNVLKARQQHRLGASEIKELRAVLLFSGTSG